MAYKKGCCHDWITAIDQFAASSFIADAIGEEFQSLFAAIKTHEAKQLLATVTDLDWKTYLPQL